jgi:3-oxoacyl-[acyl-carrier protein] reductase
MPNVIVTGGSRGLGLGIARKLSDAGYRVIAIARRPSEPLSAAIRHAGAEAPGELHFRAFDLAETAKISDLVRGLRKEFGPFYALINNAGLGTSGLLASLRDRQIAELVQVNTLAPIVLTKYVVRAMMIDRGGGRIVNIASIAAVNGFSGLAVYGATKASIVGFTRSLAREIGPLGITVNAVAPGFIDTDMTAALTGDRRDQVVRRSALKRLAEAADIADTVEFLLSDRARNITGTVVTVDAGGTA